MDFHLFRNHNFSLAVSREALGSFINIFLNISFALYILQETGSAGKFASILTLGMIPSLLVGSFSGTLVDRIADKAKLLMWIDGIRGIYLLLLFILSLVEPFSQTLIYLTVMLVGVLNMFTASAYITIMPKIVSPEELTSANALQTTLVETSNVLAPFLGTLLYSTSGIEIILLVTGVLSVLSALASFFMKIPISTIKTNSTSRFGGYINDIKEGFAIFRKNTQITSLVVNGILTHLFLFPFAMIGFPFMIKEIFGGTDLDFGLVESIQTIGALCAILGVSFLQKRYSISTNIGIGIVGMIFAVGPLFFLGNQSLIQSLQHNPTGVVLYFGFVSFLLFLMFNTYAVFFRTFYQQNITPDLLGRFGAILVMFFSLGRLIGFQVFGFVFDQKTLVIPVILLGIGMILKLLVHIPFLQIDKQKNMNIDSTSAHIK